MHITAKSGRLGLWALLLAALVMLMPGCRSKSVTVKPSQTKPVTVVTGHGAGFDDGPLKNNETPVDIADISRIVTEAMRWIGTPYRYGGHDFSGTDCSGMVMEVFKAAIGVLLPRSSREQQAACEAVNRGAIRPGDLVFFATGRDRSRTSHVGLYIGDGRMIHASTSRGVIISDIGEQYYAGRYVGAGRHPQVSRIYASADGKKNKNNKNNKNNKQSASTPAPNPAARHQQYYQPVTDIDDIITEQVDSIFTGFFD